MIWAGYAGRQVAAEEQGGAGGLVVGDVAPHGRALLVGALHVAVPLDDSGRDGVERAGRHGVDADGVGPEVVGQLGDLVLKSGLGGTHDVVAGEDALGGLEGERDDAAAVGHERRAVPGNREERVCADVEGEPEALAPGVDEPTSEIVAVGEGYAVDDDIDSAKLARDGVERGGHVVVG